MPDFRKYGIKVEKPGTAEAENCRPLGVFLRDVMKANMQNFRVFGPDENTSNKLNAIYEVSKKLWLDEYFPEDADGTELAPDGRVIEMLSEHTLEGMLEGYLLTGRHGFFSTYEAFAHVIDSMFNQHAKWLTICNHLPWRAKIASLNLLITSTVWRQDHNGFTHQDPGFLDVVVNKSAAVTRIYLPPDVNSLLSVADHCLRSEGYINVIVSDKQNHLQYLSMDDAIVHCTKGIGIWAKASTDQGQRAGRGDGLRRRHPDEGGAGRDGPAPAGVPGPEDPVRQRGGPVQAPAGHRAPARADRPRLRQPVHGGQADHLRVPRLPVADPPAGVPAKNHPNLHVRGYKEKGNINTPLRFFFFFFFFFGGGGGGGGGCMYWLGLRIAIPELQRIAVDPAYRRRGLAGGLLAAVESRVAADGATRLLLEVREDNTTAAAFYESRGFVEVGRRRGYYRDGAAAVVLGKKVDRDGTGSDYGR